MSCLFHLLLIFSITATTPRSSEEVTVLFLGDSITSGYGLDTGLAFPDLLQARVDSLGLPVRITNAGLSGETSSAGLRRVNWLLRGPIDIVVLELGANDGLRGIDLSVTRQNLQGIVDRVISASPDAAILVAGMEVPPNLGQDYTEEFRTLYADLARTNDLPLIPFLLEGVGGIPELNQSDRKHPNADGHRLVAETVWRHLEPLITTRLTR